MTLSSTSANPASRAIVNDHAKAKPADRRKASTEAGVSSISRSSANAMSLSGENFLHVFKGARSAPRADGALISRELAHPGGRHDGGPRSAGRARSARGTLTQPGWQLRLRPAAHGGLPPERYPGHRPSPASRRHARRSRLAGNGHPPGAPVLSRAKITVESALALGLRVLRMALRATLDCDLPRHMMAPIGWMARNGHRPVGTVAPRQQQSS